MNRAYRHHEAADVAGRNMFRFQPFLELRLGHALFHAFLGYCLDLQRFKRLGINVHHLVIFGRSRKPPQCIPILRGLNGRSLSVSARDDEGRHNCKP